MNTLIIFIAKYLIVVSAAATLWLWFTLPRGAKISFAAHFVIAGLLAVLLSKGIAHFYFDPRPFTVRHVTPLFAHAADNGFPSDHTTVTMLAALVSFVYSRRAGAVLILLSILIGIARVLSFVHSPIDILGAILIAAVSVLAAVRLLPILGLSFWTKSGQPSLDL